MSIRLGELEVLATGGFWGHLNVQSNKLVPFLGSSIHSLPHTIYGEIVTSHTKSIFVLNKNIQVEPFTTNRILNQYLKNNSTEPWAYHSKRFYDDDFFPENPLHFISDSAYNQRASLLLRIYANKKVNQNEIKDTIKIIERTKEKTLSSPHKNIKTLLKYTQARFVSVVRLNNQEVLASRKQLISICNSSLYKAIKASNVKKENKAANNYKAIKIDLFK